MAPQSNDTRPLLFYIDSADLAKMFPRRCRESIRRDMHFYRDVLGVPEGVKGLPLDQFAAYINRDPHEMAEFLGIRLR
jgi:hypothetical protein